MPTYEYECRNCGRKFAVVQRISEHGTAKVVCPKCKGSKVKRDISAVMTKTSRKS